MDGRVFDPSDAAPSVRSSELLGFPPEARVLIINLDDFWMYHAINAAVVHSIEEGIASSCSLMVPCPWALDHPTGLVPDQHTSGKSAVSYSCVGRGLLLCWPIH
jgi:hypothetical protein